MFRISSVIRQFFFFLPKQSQKSRSVLQDGSRSLRLFRKGKMHFIAKFHRTDLAIFSSPEHKVLKVSYCDHPVSGVRRQSSVVRRPSCVVNNSFKAHLLLNYWTNFKIISHKCSPEAPLPKLLKWFRSAEQNGRQS